MILLELKHLKKSFDELEVIKDFSLSVKEGEVVSIIGPSGSGKSSILRCLTMLEQMMTASFPIWESTRQKVKTADVFMHPKKN